MNKFKAILTAALLFVSLPMSSSTVIVVPYMAPDMIFSGDKDVRCISFEDDQTVKVYGDGNTLLFTDTESEIKRIEFTEVIGLSHVCDDAPSVVVYPNPAESIVNVKGLTLGNHVEILTSLGSRLTMFKAESEEQTLDVSQLPSGIYFIRINSTQVVQFIKK